MRLYLLLRNDCIPVKLCNVNLNAVNFIFKGMRCDFLFFKKSLI